MVKKKDNKKINLYIPSAILGGIILVALIFFWGYSDDCIYEIDGTPINEIPMYGEIEKCNKLKQNDETFIQNITNNGEYPARTASFALSILGGWGFYFGGESSTSMKRFNQAWLLDQNNFIVFWGFGVLLTEQEKYDEATNMLNKALEFYEKEGYNDLIIETFNETTMRKMREEATTPPVTQIVNFIDALKSHPKNGILCDFANVYFTKYEKTRSEEHLKEATRLANEATENKTLKSTDLNKCHDILD